MTSKDINKCGMNGYEKILLIDVLLPTILIFNLFCFKTKGFYQTCFAHLRF